MQVGKERRKALRKKVRDLQYTLECTSTTELKTPAWGHLRIPVVVRVQDIRYDVWIKSRELCK